MIDNIELIPKSGEDDFLFSFYDIFDLKLNLRRDAVFKIPVFQRNYSWNNNNLSSFVEGYRDFYKLFIKNKDQNYPLLKDNERNEYNFFNNKEAIFFGSIYISENKKNHEINLIDGQQRITTIYIFLLCAFFLLNKNKDRIKTSLNKLEDNDEKHLSFKLLRKKLKQLLINKEMDDKLNGNENLVTENVNDKNDWDTLLSLIDKKTIPGFNFDNIYQSDFRIALDQARQMYKGKKGI